MSVAAATLAQTVLLRFASRLIFFPLSPPLLFLPFFLFCLSHTSFFFFLRTGFFGRDELKTVRHFAGGDVFPPAWLPAVPKCLPGGVRERETGSAYAFVPRREHRNRGKPVSHRGGGGHVSVGHVRQSVRTQLQRFLAVHQRGLGSFLTNGKAACCVCLACVR